MPTQPAKHGGRRRAAAAAKAREQRLRDERKLALNNPDAADLRPAAISVAEFKKLTGLSHATVFRYIKKGWLKSVQFHRRRLISFDEVERFRTGE